MNTNTNQIANVKQINKNQMICTTEKFWAPITEIKDHIQRYCYRNAFTNILEVQPGNVPLSCATHVMDWSKDRIDLDTMSFPYPENMFDYVYSRHVLEDLQNPDFAFQEMIRVATSGFIETPSPLIECTSFVDNTAIPFRGYIHHRYIVWTEMDTNTLCFLPKLPVIEYLYLQVANVQDLIQNPLYWNNYYMWNPKNKPNYKIYKNGINFNIITEYPKLLERAIKQSIQYTEHFKSNLN